MELTDTQKKNLIWQHHFETTKLVQNDIEDSRLEGDWRRLAHGLGVLDGLDVTTKELLASV